MTQNFSKGNRIVVRDTAGFHRGARGVIEFVEQNGRCHVLRDGASATVFYDPSELKLEEPTCNIGMLADVRRLARYVNPIRDDAEMAVHRTPTGPARDVLAEVYKHLEMALNLLQKFDDRCVHEHYHGKK